MVPLLNHLWLSSIGSGSRMWKQKMPCECPRPKIPMISTYPCSDKAGSTCSVRLHFARNRNAMWIRIRYDHCIPTPNKTTRCKKRRLKCFWCGRRFIGQLKRPQCNRSLFWKFFGVSLNKLSIWSFEEWLFRRGKQFVNNRSKKRMKKLKLFNLVTQE